MTTPTAYTSDDFIATLLNSGQSLVNQLGLVIGGSPTQKEEFFEEIEDQTIWEISEIDLEEIITSDKIESQKNIDWMLKKQVSPNKLLHFKNGIALNSVYTGNSLSKVRYTTPQEAYFTDKILQSDCLVAIEVNEFSDVGMTVRRTASWTVDLDTKKSAFQNFMARLKNVSTHGNTFRDKRPGTLAQ